MVAVSVRSYSRMIGQTSCEQDTNIPGSARCRIALTCRSWAGLR
ncbi:Uncharacterised protein [Bordetella pertussis]|nr:Uncharacterised protein [Bordetella pertussis]CFP62621.1 Uncharacterised protein [Bordetella pertussis]